MTTGTTGVYVGRHRDDVARPRCTCGAGTVHWYQHMLSCAIIVDASERLHVTPEQILQTIIYTQRKDSYADNVS